MTSTSANSPCSIPATFFSPDGSANGFSSVGTGFRVTVLCRVDFILDGRLAKSFWLSDHLLERLTGGLGNEKDSEGEKGRTDIGVGISVGVAVSGASKSVLGFT